MQFLPIFTLKLIIFCHVFTHLEGAKVLFLFPMPFKSQFRSFSVLVEALARRGHEVTLLTPFPMEKTIPNYREIVLSQVIYGDIHKDNNMTAWGDMSLFRSLIIKWDLVTDWTEKVLASEPVQRLISSRDEYDVIFGGFSFLQEAFLAFGHRFNAPLIEIVPEHLSPTTAMLVGSPYSFSYFSDSESPYIERLSFLERLHNTIFGLFKIASIFWYELPNHEELVGKYMRYRGSDERPPLRSLLQNISLVLVNSHFSLHPPRPVSPNIIEIGGFHVKPPDALPDDIQEFMDSASDGIVFVSFGTNVKTHMLSKEREETLASVFMALKQRVLWRWDNPDASKDKSKIMIKDWMPQTSVLAHPNCVLFITHGGISSLIEAIHFGVPLVGFPFMFDQFHNTEYMQKTGIGLKLNIHVPRDCLLQAVTKVLGTPSFKEKIKEQSRIMRDQPLSPLDRAIFWVEYVIRHQGAHHLKPTSVYLPFYQYVLLDVIAFLAIPFTFAVIFFWKIFSALCRYGASDNHEREPELSE